MSAEPPMHLPNLVTRSNAARAAREGERTRRRRRVRIAPSWVLALLLVVFLVLPVIGLVERAAIAGTLLEVLRRPIVYEAIRLSMETTALVLILSLVLGSPLALVLARRRFPGSTVLDSIVDLPIVLPPA